VAQGTRRRAGNPKKEVAAQMVAIFTVIMAFSFDNKGCLNILCVWVWLSLASILLIIFGSAEESDYRRKWVIKLDRQIWLAIGVTLIYNDWIITGATAVITFFLIISNREAKG